VEPTPRTKRNWIQRLPATLFGLLCITAALVGACVSFILGAMAGWIIGIDSGDIEALVLLGFVFAGAVVGVLLVARARKRQLVDVFHGHPIATDIQTGRWTRTLRRPWVYVGLFLLAGVVLMLPLFDRSPSNLRVVSYPARVSFPLTLSPRLTITNIGDHPVRIFDIAINDRKDCSTSDDVFSQADSRFPVELKVGDTGTWFTTCGIVRATVKTSDGTATYSF
jgi:hypothetical protein